MGGDCDNDDTSQATERQRNATEDLHTEAWKQVGMPAVDNFQEMRILKQIIELRDRQLTTYTYTVDRDAELHFLCPSMGYGIPYSTQMTNPEKLVDAYRDEKPIPQPEPNGLYMPNSVSATWVLCQNPQTDGVAPVYSEPKLLVSPFPLEYDHRYADPEEVESIVDTESSK
jgi:hypothetical protein